MIETFAMENTNCMNEQKDREFAVTLSCREIDVKFAMAITIKNTLTILNLNLLAILQDLISISYHNQLFSTISTEMIVLNEIVILQAFLSTNQTIQHKTDKSIEYVKDLQLYWLSYHNLTFVQRALQSSLLSSFLLWHYHSFQH